MTTLPIQELTIEGFQAYRDKFKLTPDRITTIIGPNDRGKSSIIRALYWLAFNRPNGDDVISWGSDLARVRIVTREGDEITRKRGARFNSYYLNGQKFSSFGQGVPEPIARAINLDEFNFELQDSPPFWLSLSPPQLSRELNRIINLEDIDAILAKLATDLRRYKTEYEVVKTRVDEAQKTVQSLSWVPVMSDRLGEVERAFENLETRRNRAILLAKLAEDATKYQNRSENAENARQGVDLAVKIGSSILVRAGKIRKLQGTIREINSLGRPKPIPNLAGIGALVDRIRDAQRRATRLSSLIDQYKRTQEAICEASDRYRIGLQKLPRTCPVCQGPLSLAPSS